jgi:hypothetical protein
MAILVCAESTSADQAIYVEWMICAFVFAFVARKVMNECGLSLS